MAGSRALLTIAAGAITALALWPALYAARTPAATFTPAPLVRDYTSRSALIAFYERQVRQQPTDQIQLRMLAQQYMQRFREQYDMGDVARAERAAQRSIELQPQGNTSAQMTLASARLSYHDFQGAIRHERDAVAGEPFNSAAVAQVASLQMEMGEYDQAQRTLASISQRSRENPTVDSIRARYDELTGKLDAARALIDRSTRTIDSDVSDPAYDRSWFHMRAGQLAFEAGDDTRAEREYEIALDDFPDNAMALLWEARLFRAEGRWRDCLAAATKSADLYPLPQALGYKADAQRALGDEAGAVRTDALIDAEQRLFDVNGINDRLLAVYYAQRRVHMDQALAAARSDYQKRGNEIYADDTMSLVCSARHDWACAYRFAARANRLGTKDPQLQYHLALADLRTGRVSDARALLQQALAENPHFDAFDAPEAKAVLASLK